MSKIQTKISLTGASGRIARALYPDLLAGDQEVLRVSRTESPDVLSVDNWLQPEVFARQDVILHLAWSSVPKISEDFPGLEWIYDIPLLGRILSAMHQVPGEKPHLVFFSSAGTIYGGGQSILNEESTLAPTCMYGWAKLHAEQLIAQTAQRIGFDYSILRISNLYGFLSRENDQQGIIPYLIQAALTGKEFQVWGDGAAEKDYLFYSDFLLALKYIIHHRITGTFNLSYGTSYSINSLVKIVEKRTGRSMKLVHTNAPSWDTTCQKIDSSLFTSVSSWKPTVELPEGIAQMISIIKKNLAG